MRIFTKGASVVLFATAIGCQQPAPQQVETGSEPDTLSYSFTTIEKQIPCKGEDKKMCLEVYIEKMKVESGTSAEAARNIEKVLLDAISETDNSQGQARSPENIASNLEEEYTRIKEEMPDYNLPWQYKSDFEVYLNHNGLFATQLTNYSFTGGAHPSSFVYYYTFDADNGKRLGLKDLIISKKYEQLRHMSEAAFRTSRDIDSTQSLEEAGFWFEVDRFALNDNYKYTPEGLTIVFNPYEIAPFSEGEIVILFPYSAIEEMVKPEFRFRAEEIL